MNPLTIEAALTECTRRACIDVRDERAFASGHLEGAGHLPFAEFEARRYELPARDQPCLVLGADAAEARAAAERLESLGYGDVAWLDAPLAEFPAGRGSRGPAARLWRPAPFLEHVLPRLPRGRVLDVAAGAGREAVFLALHGFEVQAWDHDPEALARASALARRHGVRIETVVSDLERTDLELPRARFAVVMCFRFLHRPLFARLEAAVAPGGVLVYETFRLGQEKFGRPLRRQFLLEGGELSTAFPSLDVEQYAECEPAGGPITARLLARRPAAAR